MTLYIAQFSDVSKKKKSVHDTSHKHKSLNEKMHA